MLVFVSLKREREKDSAFDSSKPRRRNNSFTSVLFNLCSTLLFEILNKSFIIFSDSSFILFVKQNFNVGDLDHVFTRLRQSKISFSSSSSSSSYLPVTIDTGDVALLLLPLLSLSFLSLKFISWTIPGAKSIVFFFFVFQLLDWFDWERETQKFNAEKTRKKFRERSGPHRHLSGSLPLDLRPQSRYSSFKKSENPTKFVPFFCFVFFFTPPKNSSYVIINRQTWVLNNTKQREISEIQSSSWWRTEWSVKIIHELNLDLRYFAKSEKILKWYQSCWCVVLHHMWCDVLLW